MSLPGKLKFLSLIFFIFGASRVTGQVNVGVKVGWNHNFAKYDSDFKTDQSLSGWHVGLYSQFTLAKKLYLIPELQFSTRNYSLYAHFDDIHLGYIEVPVLLSWTPAKWINLEAGPQVAFKIFTKSTDAFVTEEVFDKNIDFGLVAGPRFNFTNNLSVVARYWLSLVPFADRDFYDVNGNPLGQLKVYNRAVEISFTWTFKPSSN